ncbi:MAG: adenylate/guanylate cyclase domain-containing protein [Bryobacteraceae bacterium]
MSIAILELISDTGPERFELTRGAVCKVGRSRENTIVLDDYPVSRAHCMVQCTPEGVFYLTDMGSRNGTFVNGQRLSSPIVLRGGDTITVGGHTIIFHSGDQTVLPLSKDELSGTIDVFSERLITVMVADIRGYTALAQKLGEVRISQLIATFTRESGKLLTRRGACAHKFIGDAVMAIWLHVSDQPGPGELGGVFAALEEISTMVAGLKAKFQLDAPVRVGAGINTGPACVANIGTEIKPDFTALSDSVNLAFRLEAATKEVGCDLLLGRWTYQILAPVGAKDLFEERVEELKGYTQRQHVYAASIDAAQTMRELLSVGADFTSGKIRVTEPRP